MVHPWSATLLIAWNARNQKRICAMYVKVVGWLTLTMILYVWHAHQVVENANILMVLLKFVLSAWLKMDFPWMQVVYVLMTVELVTTVSLGYANSVGQIATNVQMLNNAQHVPPTII